MLYAWGMPPTSLVRVVCEPIHTIPQDRTVRLWNPFRGTHIKTYNGTRCCTIHTPSPAVHDVCMAVYQDTHTHTSAYTQGTGMKYETLQFPMTTASML